MNLRNKSNTKYELFIYFVLFSIFIRDFKIYIPLFVLNILYVIYLIFKKEIHINLKKWNITLALFIIWTVINTIIASFIFKHPVYYSNVIKLLLNMSFLLSIYFVVDGTNKKFHKKTLVRFLEFIILINFIQIIYIYFDGKLFNDFFSGALTESSDAAYTISSYHNIIGAENKNIWATKFALIYMIYLYICAFDNFNINLIEKISFIILGIVTVVLLLSRTAQVAIIIPIVFLAFYSMRNLNYKYRIGIYAVSGILFLGALFVFFDKFFHLEFNMTDGGFTRLYIWKEFIISVFDTHFIVGNGIGYSAYFIQDILGRFESNLHNVFLNIFFELGIIGIVLYITFIIQFFKDFITRKNILKNLFMIIFPMLAIVCLQYLGYDNDLVVTLTLLIIINMIMKKDEQRI